MAKQGDTGRSKRPSGKGDSAALNKRDSGVVKKKTTSARKSARVDEDDDDAPKGKRKNSARASAPQAAPGNDKAKRMFLYATPFTIVILLGIGGYLYSLPDPKPAETVVIDPNTDAKAANDKYVQAKALFDKGHSTEGPAGTAMVKQAQKLLQEANEALQAARDKMDKNGDAAGGKNEKGQMQYAAFEDLDPKINSLLGLVRKELLMRE